MLTNSPPATAAGADAHLALGGVVRRFGDVTAVAGIDLAVQRGELVTILGPSGSGKTTLLKIIAGFELPDAGVVRLRGEDITFATPAKRGIGMVFQNYALFPHLTVERNVAFPLEMRSVPRAQIRERVTAVLQLVGLGDLAARLPRELSGGQQQRVALARSVVFDPGLLLLDEPFGALDRKLREQMQLEVKRLQRRLGLTALFVTHDQEEALVLSDRIAVMSEGRVEQLGTPEEIYAHPVNWFVADFVGESNLFRGRLAADDAGRPFALIASGTRINVPVSSFAMDSEVGVLVRPERPRLIGDGQHADNVVRGRIVEVIYVGESVKYRLRVGAAGDLLVRWPFRERGGTLKAGDDVTVGWNVSDMHLVAVP
ncbi:MAG TPA: ABC transporter ATP-binding protein [Casimicrobiaceae bacterium]|nr:ABC transporter ATP-binding protein [Casimicrobiaceae bacterium]